MDIGLNLTKMGYKEQKLRKYPWGELGKLKLLKFIVYTVTIIPLLLQMLEGYWRKQDKAWLFHIPACWITIAVYTFGTIHKSFELKPEDRINWQINNRKEI